MELKPCPFCGGEKLDYSEKRVYCDSSTNVYYHAAVYCRNCHAYGRRVLSEKAWSRDYEAQRALLYGLRERAVEAWNRRVNNVGIVCDVNTKPKPMTNGDLIRAMSDEELAVWLKQPAEV